MYKYGIINQHSKVEPIWVIFHRQDVVNVLFIIF